MTTPKMKPEIKALWLEALRSGEYDQTKGWLAVPKDDGAVGYCCLGVLCDIAVKQGVEVPVTKSISGKALGYGADANNMSLPREVMDWAGLPNDPVVATPDGISEAHTSTTITLAELNDEHSDFTFPVLADLIEEQL